MKRLSVVAIAFALLAGIGLSGCDEETQVQMAIHEYFPGALNAKAKRVANCESRMNPRAVSAGGGNHGLFQINNVHKPMVQQMGHSWSQIYDPFVNAKVARRVFDLAGGSWQPWGCRNA